MPDRWADCGMVELTVSRVLPFPLLNPKIIDENQALFNDGEKAWLWSIVRKNKMLIILYHVTNDAWDEMISLLIKNNRIGLLKW